MVVENEKFILDYLGKYYFYEIEDFQKQCPEADKILKEIEEYSRSQQGDHAFTKSKFGNITESYTEKQVEVIVPTQGDWILLNNQKRHLDLNYKMEIRKLEDHIRVATRLIEEGQSISCLMYINYAQEEAFLNALNQLKSRSPGTAH